MINQQPVLLVLTGVGEEQPVELGIPARSGVGDGGRQADEISAESHRERTEPGVPADPGRMRGDVHSAGIPILERHEGQGRAVADGQFDVAGEDGLPGVIEHHRDRGERADLDHQVAVGRSAGAVQPDDHRRVRGRLGGHGDDHGMLGPGHRERRHPVGRGEHPPDAGVIGADALNRHARGRFDIHRESGVSGRATEQAAEPAQRREPPLLLAAGR